MTDAGQPARGVSSQMSTTQSRSFEPVAQYHPAEAFDEFVFYNPEICSNCYQRIKRVETITVEHGTLGTRERQFSERVDAGVAGHGDVGARVFRPRTFCEECGSQSGRDHPDTLDKHTAVEQAATVATRLDEAGIPVDAAVLRYVVWKLKSKEDLCGYDREIFSRASKLAIQHV